MRFVAALAHPIHSAVGHIRLLLRRGDVAEGPLAPALQQVLLLHQLCFELLQLPQAVVGRRRRSHSCGALLGGALVLLPRATGLALPPLTAFVCLMFGPVALACPLRLHDLLLASLHRALLVSVATVQHLRTHAGVYQRARLLVRLE